MEILDLVDFNANVANLLEEDNIVTVENAETDEFNLSPSINDNFKELENACPEGQPDTQAASSQMARTSSIGTSNQRQELPNLYGRSRKQSGSLAKKGDRQPGVMHVDLAAFEPSADGHKYCLAAAGGDN